MSEENTTTLFGRDFGEFSSRTTAVVAAIVALAATFAAGIVFPDSIAGTLTDILTSEGTLSSALRLSVPIALAALGGIFAEKSGVINIGLEGLLIISAFTAIYVTDITGGVWIGFVGGVVASVLLALLFAIVVIEFRADQIIAGLAVWLIALGLAPFASQVIYGRPNSPSVDTPGTITIPVLSDIPFFGALFDASPTVYLMFAAVALSWYVLNRTTFGRWVRASGENPKALDTAGVDVSRIRYAAVLLSGVLAGMGGAALSLDLGQFTGNGPTMVNGKGFIAIVAYLFGNYNPVGAFFSTLLFAGLDAMQTVLQLQGIGLPRQLIRIIPFVMVIVVLAFVGRTRIPAAAGEHYDTGDDNR
ncbi:ABC transporter permease [Haloferax sp. MBLA0076]|uniref:ABC transporter permease n=1 Tax=Haloferax litoreum TaxID=2666140 RepID=A0A6A8GKG8_9EURY|nr:MULTISPECIES: ABC transporter permease [Haloferax]KAB1194378.1 ABC transporter permease [Haloferax sp. CBA1148]MRX22942.1 ABC transporter permease [Haloferax litoreum]